MHFLTSLIIIAGFIFVFCFGLLEVTRDHSELSVHVAPEMLIMPCEKAKATESYVSNPSGLSET